MAKRLIMNADDYGRSSDISRGIRFAHLHGIVTSTTCMMNMPSAVDDIRSAQKETPNLGIGVHLVLTAGKPVLPASQKLGLTDSEGNFWNKSTFLELARELDTAIVKSEWRAQIEAFITAAGNRPTHLDSHHHSSYFTTGLFTAMLELAREYDLPIRLPLAHGSSPLIEDIPEELLEEMNENAPIILEKFQPRSPDAFFASFYGEQASVGEITQIINHMIPNGTFEIMCHPGYVDEAIARESSYSSCRETEIQILTDPILRSEIEKRGVTLVSFAQL